MLSVRLECCNDFILIVLFYLPVAYEILYKDAVEPVKMLWFEFSLILKLVTADEEV